MKGLIKISNGFYRYRGWDIVREDKMWRVKGVINHSEKTMRNCIYWITYVGGIYKCTQH